MDIQCITTQKVHQQMKERGKDGEKAGSHKTNDGGKVRGGLDGLRCVASSSRQSSGMRKQKKQRKKGISLKVEMRKRERIPRENT